MQKNVYDMTTYPEVRAMWDRVKEYPLSGEGETAKHVFDKVEFVDMMITTFHRSAK